MVIEAERLLAVLRPDDAVPYAIAMYAGLRTMEVTAVALQRRFGVRIAGAPSLADRAALDAIHQRSAISRNVNDGWSRRGSARTSAMAAARHASASPRSRVARDHSALPVKAFLRRTRQDG